MPIFAPSYYPKFKCIADRCTHSCCVGWEIDVDPDTLEKYQALPGETGERIRAGILLEAEGAHFSLCPNGSCPQLDERGLCKIISALGEDYLCDICREHPRFYHKTAQGLECGLGACCEEAARLILQEDGYDRFVPIAQEENDGSEGTFAGFCVQTKRQALFSLLRDRTLPYAERRERIAACYAAPAQLDTAEKRNILAALEYLDAAHKPTLLAALDGKPTQEHPLLRERFLAYLIFRHTGAASDEASFSLSVSLALLLEELFALLIAATAVPPVWAAVLLSEELEYSEDNTQALRFALQMKL